MLKFHRRAAVVLAGVGAGLTVMTSAVAMGTASQRGSWPYAPAEKSAVLAAVGDVACEPNTPENSSTPSSLKCGSPTLGGMAAQFAVADQIEGMKPNLVALLGDEQYEVGKYTDFMQSFDKTFGAFKFLQRPAPGNHEYYAYTKHGDNEAAQNGAGYFQYYNGADMSGTIRPQGQAGDYNQGWYSYDLGAWHIVSLNAECASAAFGNNCDPTQAVLAQETAWLAKDLASHNNQCTLAYWHQPTFTATGATGTGTSAGFASAEGAAADAWWKLLYRNGADVVLGGHEHVYARFQPMDPAGNVDLTRGITQFTIGTGGEDLDTLSAPAALTAGHVVTGQDKAFGAMALTLNHNGFSWSYKPVLVGPGSSSASLSYADAGSMACHGSSHDE